MPVPREEVNPNTVRWMKKSRAKRRRVEEEPKSTGKNACATGRCEYQDGGLDEEVEGEEEEA